MYVMMEKWTEIQICHESAISFDSLFIAFFFCFLLLLYKFLYSFLSIIRSKKKKLKIQVISHCIIPCRDSDRKYLCVTIKYATGSELIMCCSLVNFLLLFDT